METAGACFERCPGQAPAGVLMLGQLEASAGLIVTQSRKTPWKSLTALVMGSNPNVRHGHAQLDFTASINRSLA
jgi:hypothetical protein